jgi:DNA-binding response OmpR family regulator
MAKIYIAEDDADIRTILAHSLTEQGHEVLSATDGETALQAIVHDPPDVLVLDIMMPGLDGFEVLDGLERTGVRKKLRVLILSARNSESERLEGFEHGADLYLTKPFDHDEFVAAVRDLLESSPEELSARRDSERDKALLLAQLESVFNE